MNRPLVKYSILVGTFIIGISLFSWVWGYCRIFVEPGNMLVITSRFGSDNPNPQVYTVVDKGVKGIQREVLGEGRHFYNPLSHDRSTRPVAIDIGPLKIGIVESQWGTPLPEGDFLADYGQRGVMKEVLKPGRHRINPYAYKVIIEDTVVIEPGFVGCVTAQWGTDPDPGKLSVPGQRGIQENVLQPGIYYLNPRAFKVDAVEVGYRNIDFGDVEFPSRDGFPIRLDMSVIWGIQPRNVPTIVDNFGSVEDVVTKIIKPQVQSICRIEGSKYGAKEFIEGKTREKFQTTFTAELERVYTERYLDVLKALVRNIEVPEAVRLPIQQAKIAAEEQMTKKEQRNTQDVLNELEELKADVVKGEREVDAQTDRLVASIRAEGERAIANLQALKEVEVSVTNRKIAGVLADKDMTLGQADATVKGLSARAAADRLRVMAEAIGGGATYANYEFVRRLPDDFEIRMRYAGEGTLWTDAGSQDSLREAATLRILKQQYPTAQESKPER